MFSLVGKCFYNPVNIYSRTQKVKKEMIPVFEEVVFQQKRIAFFLVVFV